MKRFKSPRSLDSSALRETSMINDNKSENKKNSVTDAAKSRDSSAFQRKLHRKGAHLTFAERSIIQSMIENQCSFREIARTLGCAVNTVINEYRRGKADDGRARSYHAEEGQAQYDENRENCGRHTKIEARKAFIDYVVTNFKENHWSFETSVKNALDTGTFKREDMVCAKTIYNYVDKKMIKGISISDLPLKARRKYKSPKIANK